MLLDELLRNVRLSLKSTLLLRSEMTLFAVTSVDIPVLSITAEPRSWCAILTDLGANGPIGAFDGSKSILLLHLVLHASGTLA